jgi:hypothetical protein
MHTNTVLKRLSICEKYFKDTGYWDTVKAAREAAFSNDMALCHSLLDNIPNEVDLFNSLVEKLKNKPVYRTLKKINENDSVSKFTLLKGLSSLMTHTLIELENGHNEYGLLIPYIYEKIGKSIFGDNNE